jgi:hypothetical protein
MTIKTINAQALELSKAIIAGTLIGILAAITIPTTVKADREPQAALTKVSSDTGWPDGQ